MIDIEGIRARHKSATPNPISTPAWFYAERDIGWLLEAYDELFAEWAALSQDDGKVERALERARAEGFQQGLSEGVVQGRKIAERILDDITRKLTYTDDRIAPDDRTASGGLVDATPPML